MQNQQDMEIQVATDWIFEKDAVYLCKEDKVFYYESITGKEDDMQWQSLTIPQLLRVLKYTKIEVSEENLIRAFQEAGVVYVCGVRSLYKTPQDIFNFNSCNITEQEKVIKNILETLEKNKYKGIKLADFVDIYNGVLNGLKLKDISRQQRNKYLRKHALLYNYTLREEGNRIYIRGQRTTVLTNVHTNDKDIDFYINPVRIKTLIGIVKTKMK